MNARRLIRLDVPRLLCVPAHNRGESKLGAESNSVARTAGTSGRARAVRLLPPASPRTDADGPVAFVFQGGGSLTAPQVGMLWALSEVGLVPDLVIGSSAGAFNAVAFASAPTVAGVERLETFWISLRRRHVAPFSVRTLASALTGRADGLVSNSAARDVLQSGLVPLKLSDTSLPAHVVATDLASGDAVVLSDGDTVASLLASAAFPGIYPPVTVGERRLVDGGVAADIPVLQAEALGARISYILPAAVSDAAKSPPRGPVPLAYHALGQILDAAARRDLAAARGVVHMLPAPSPQANNPADFRDTARLIDEGYRLASEWLDGHVASAGAATRPDASSSGPRQLVTSAI